LKNREERKKRLKENVSFEAEKKLRGSDHHG
jgi:hypothetical protein